LRRCSCTEIPYPLNETPFVTLNRGYSRPRKNGDTGIKEPEYYVLPIEYIEQIRDPDNDWGKIVKSRLVDLDKYRDQWGLIKDHLEDRNLGRGK